MIALVMQAERFGVEAVVLGEVDRQLGKPPAVPTALEALAALRRREEPGVGVVHRRRLVPGRGHGSIERAEDHDGAGMRAARQLIDADLAGPDRRVGDLGLALAGHADRGMVNPSTDDVDLGLAADHDAGAIAADRDVLDMDGRLGLARAADHDGRLSDRPRILFLAFAEDADAGDLALHLLRRSQVEPHADGVDLAVANLDDRAFGQHCGAEGLGVDVRIVDHQPAAPGSHGRPLAVVVDGGVDERHPSAPLRLNAVGVVRFVRLHHHVLQHHAAIVGDEAWLARRGGQGHVHRSGSGIEHRVLVARDGHRVIQIDRLILLAGLAVGAKDQGSMVGEPVQRRLHRILAAIDGDAVHQLRRRTGAAAAAITVAVVAAVVAGLAIGRPPGPPTVRVMMDRRVQQDAEVRSDLLVHLGVDVAEVTALRIGMGDRSAQAYGRG